MSNRQMTTTRIRLTKNRLIYCTSQIATECKELTIRLNQIIHPQRGKTDELEHRLRTLALTRPGEFANSAHATLRTGLNDKGEQTINRLSPTFPWGGY